MLRSLFSKKPFFPLSRAWSRASGLPSIMWYSRHSTIHLCACLPPPPRLCVAGKSLRGSVDLCAWVSREERRNISVEMTEAVSSQPRYVSRTRTQEVEMKGSLYRGGSGPARHWALEASWRHGHSRGRSVYRGGGLQGACVKAWRAWRWEPAWHGQGAENSQSS